MPLDHRYPDFPGGSEVPVSAKRFPKKIACSQRLTPECFVLLCFNEDRNCPHSLVWKKWLPDTQSHSIVGLAVTCEALSAGDHLLGRTFALSYCFHVENRSSSLLMRLLQGKTLQRALIHLEKYNTQKKDSSKLLVLIHPHGRDFVNIFGSLPFINHLLQRSEHEEESNESHLV